MADRALEGRYPLLRSRQIDDHQRKCERLAAELAAAQGAPVRLGKSTSNLFRQRDARVRKIDVRALNRVLTVDRELLIADVEGMTTYEALVDETLRYDLLPAVVPQLKTITIGGAVSGVGIESSSFRFGLVHETIEEMEILTGDGRIVVCSPRQNQDLFYGFPNSYGTLGYALRLKVRLIPAKQYVRVTHTRFSDPEKYFARIAEIKSVDYLDGAVFGRDEMFATTGEFTGSAPRTSDYTYMKMYYQSIREKREDWLTARDYIWRWDTDWFWCSKQFHLQTPALRFLATKWALNSRTYQRIMRAGQRFLPRSTGAESVIQDVDIPIEHAVEFFEFLFAEIGIQPVWICPFQSCRPEATFDLYALDPRKLYVNFGFWDVIPTAYEDGYFNKKIERKALDLQGKKGLYSTAFYDRETFWKIYNKPRYDELKRKYDPGGAFLDLFDKCVGRK